MSDQLVVARFKSDTSSNPRFTRTASIEELLAECVKALPVDQVYFVIQHPDGAGYTLREAGLITLDILPSGHQHQTTPLTPPTLSISQPVGSGYDNGGEAHPVYGPSPIAQPGPSQASQTPQFEPMTGDDFFVFPKPKSQAELLAERGLEQPPIIAPKKATKKARKKPTKSTLKDEDIPDSQLPNPVSHGSVSITGRIQATPEQAAAASQFGKRS